jgi:tetratricopeptide (TPR) repeat protein
MLELAGWGSTFVVRYELHFNLSLQEVLSDPDPLIRLGHMVQVLLSMNHWLACLGSDIVPFPADIVFKKDGQAYLLVLPQWRLPDAGAVIAAPQRALYLAPEYVRGMDSKDIGYNANRYTIGAMLLQCLCETPQSQPSDLLLQAAKGILWNPALPSLLAYWQQQSSGIRQALDIALQLTDTRPQVRSAVSIQNLGHNLQQWVDQIRPQKALNERVNQGDWEAADRLLQDVLLVEESYEIFCLAAEIATQRRRFLEAAQYCEKAIERQPTKEQAYLQQFQILTSKGARQELQMLIEKRLDLGQRVDLQISRDFRMLPPVWRTDDRVGNLAEHMVWRGQYAQAVDFLKNALAAPPVLVTGDEISELRLPLQLLQIEVLARIESGRPLTLARQAVATLRQSIRSMYDQDRLKPQTYKTLGDLCRNMEEMIKEQEAQID